MTSKMRAQLKSLAANEPALFQIGKDGVTQAVVEAVDAALEKRELVKLTVLKTADDPNAVLAVLAERVHAQPVTAIGNKIVLYRFSTRENIKHVLDGVKA